MSGNESSNSDARVYVLFGATGGIGSELCRRLAERGGRLVLAARDEDRLTRLASVLNAEMRIVDATDGKTVEECLQWAVETYGRVDGVANCVGSLLLKPAHLTTDEEWGNVLATNLGSAFNVVRGAARTMQRTGGSIVLVSSAAARLGLASHEAIAAAKAGIVGLTRSAAATYATREIRVNCVAPGLVRTPMTGQITSNETAMKASLAMHALGRVGEPADIASMMAWLLSEESAWVTGQVFGIDGGLSTVRARRAG
jgi:NAD(P)-dependent dehydrogenase (short-subunit alcohol dehydrogenase family)